MKVLQENIMFISVSWFSTCHYNYKNKQSQYEASVLWTIDDSMQRSYLVYPSLPAVLIIRSLWNHLFFCARDDLFSWLADMCDLLEKLLNCSSVYLV